MWETRSVQITVRLPHDIAEQAEEVQKADPEFLSRVVSTVSLADLSITSCASAAGTELLRISPPRAPCKGLDPPGAPQ